MSNKLFKGIGEIAEKILGDVVGRSLVKKPNAGDTVGNIADSIIDNITGALGGGIQGKGRSGGGRGSGGQGRSGRGDGCGRLSA